MFVRREVLYIFILSAGIAEAQSNVPARELADIQRVGNSIISTYRQNSGSRTQPLNSRPQVDSTWRTSAPGATQANQNTLRPNLRVPTPSGRVLRTARKAYARDGVVSLPPIMNVIGPKRLPQAGPRKRYVANRIGRFSNDNDLLIDDEHTESPSNRVADGDDLLADDSDDLLTNDSDDLLINDDDTLAGDDDTLDDETLSTSKKDAAPSDRRSNGGSDSGKQSEDYVDPHYELFAKNCYPSASQCKQCHEQHYREWSVSSHAYATVSPMFQKFEQTINNLANGTISYFCLRCHSPIATAMAVSRDESPWDQIPAAREGVTCIVCHRVVENYGKVNGERRIEKGPIFAPVVGRKLNSKLNEVLSKKSHYKVKTSPDEKGPGTDIHTDVIKFEQIGSSHFCVSCHQVAVYPGIKLEIVWEQYRASPACKKGVSCQDCHMGSVPGKALGYDTGPTAIVGEKKINPNRRHSNHMFVGPGYSIAHPGTFPWNPKAEDWTAYEWLKFDWRAGWGTERFEELVEDEKISPRFPKEWMDSDDRMDAREIIDDNLNLLAEKKRNRFLLMENTSKVDGPYFKHRPRAGKPLRFHYVVHNLSDGHHMPSGSLGAQPQLWLNVALSDPCGNTIWESGYVDANGDMADMHSLEVLAGRLKADQQIFNLQTKFLITHVKGPDREMYLPVNTDFDQLPFIRPSGFPVMNLNHPPFIRLETHSVPPLGNKKAKYSVPAKLIQQPGKYRLSVRMRSRAEPIYFMRFCGSTPEMERGMNERMLNFHQHAYEFIVQ